MEKEIHSYYFPLNLIHSTTAQSRWSTLWAPGWVTRCSDHSMKIKHSLQEIGILKVVLAWPWVMRRHTTALLESQVALHAFLGQPCFFLFFFCYCITTLVLLDICQYVISSWFQAWWKEWKGAPQWLVTLPMDWSAWETKSVEQQHTSVNVLNQSSLGKAWCCWWGVKLKEKCKV